MYMIYINVLLATANVRKWSTESFHIIRIMFFYHEQQNYKGKYFKVNI